MRFRWITRATLWTSALLMLSLFVFPRDAAMVAKAFFDWRILQSQGAYPFVMLGFLFMAMLSSKRRAATLSTASRVEVPWLAFAAASLAAAFGLSLLGGGALLLHSVLALVLAAYGLSVLFLPAFRHAAKYVLAFAVSASLPALGGRLAVSSMVAGYASVIASVTRLTGLPVAQDGWLLAFPSPADRTIGVVINSDCLGLAAFSVFLLLTLLAQFNIGFGRLAALKILVGGFLAIHVLNIVRIAAVLQVGALFGEDALWYTHAYLGYTLFGVFYTAYLVALAKFFGRGLARGEV